MSDLDEAARRKTRASSAVRDARARLLAAELELAAATEAHRNAKRDAGAS